MITVGLPRALLYYKFSVLWETFFRELGCDVVASGETTGKMLEDGCSDAVDECCLPAKIFLGHVRAVKDSCDVLFVPRMTGFGRNEELCARFYGLYDIVRTIHPAVPLLRCNISGEGDEGLSQIGKTLGIGWWRVESARRRAVQAQHKEWRRQADEQEKKWSQNSVDAKVLIAAQPYILHDRLMGGMVTQMVKEQGGQIMYSDRCGRHCAEMSRVIAPRMYWAMNKEYTGAIAHNRRRADGVILLTAFPCGGGALVSEMITRSVSEVPMTQILLDGMQGEGGMQTRVECFMDIVQERRRKSIAV